MRVCSLLLIVAGMSWNPAGGHAAEVPMGDAAEIFEALDANDDDVLDPAEIGTTQRAAFDRLVRLGDRSQDGRLTREEYLAAWEAQRSPKGESAGGSPPEAGTSQPERPELDPELLFRMADQNEDGRITVEELPERIRPRLEPLFERLGKTEITREDLSRAGEKLRQFGGGRLQQMSGQFLERLDRNGDGVIQREEVPEQAQERLQPLFDQLGKDGIRISELQARAGEMLGRTQAESAGQPTVAQAPASSLPTPEFVRVLDTDADARLSRKELAGLAARFDRLDRNSDGQLDVSEILGERSEGPSDGRLKDMKAARPSSPPREPESGGTGDKPSGEVSQLFQRADRDGDGTISEAEAPERLKQRFSQVDRNGDGRITVEEAGEALSKRAR
jgi:Ca2+-binding EF-hand superfamily protein